MNLTVYNESENAPPVGVLAVPRLHPSAEIEVSARGDVMWIHGSLRSYWRRRLESNRRRANRRRAA